MFRVKTNGEYGRYVVATKDVEKSSLILDETPVMCAPWPIDDNVTFIEPLCLGCCAHMKNTHSGSSLDKLKKVPRCSKCNWPVCSRTCEELHVHKDNECPLLISSNLPYPPPGPHMNIVTTSVLIQLIRCLLIKRRNTDVWTEQVLNLQKETQLGTLPWNFYLLLDDIKEIFPGLEADLGDRDECCRILSIININAFSNTFNHNSDFAGCAICLFLDASMIAHSCTPNCWWTLTEDASHRIVIKASEPIKAGDLITVCYSNQYAVYGTYKRQEMFRNVGGFTCKCNRCYDPYELGSFVSSMVCESCVTGYTSPESPTGYNTDWKCDRCGHIDTCDAVETLVKAMDSRLTSCSGSVPLLVRFLENCKTLLHNNHWIVTQTEDAIMKEWANDPDIRYTGTCTQEIMMTCEYFISICYHILSVRNITSPGLSFHRVRYLLFYARARMARLEFLVTIMEDQISDSMPPSAKTSSNSVDKEIANLRQDYQEILQLYDEVIEYRQMSCADDSEIKAEIEHLITLMKPIVQLEPHAKVDSGAKVAAAGTNQGGCTLT